MHQTRTLREDRGAREMLKEKTPEAVEVSHEKLEVELKWAESRIRAMTGYRDHALKQRDEERARNTELEAVLNKVIADGVAASEFPSPAEAVDHPAHYNFGTIEVIEVIEDWNLGAHASNVVKYIARAPHKGTELEDLRKARWYLDRLISLTEDRARG